MEAAPLITLADGRCIPISPFRAAQAINFANDEYWPSVRERLKLENGATYADDTWKGLREFLSVKAAFGDIHMHVSGIGIFAPPDRTIDAAWHSMILASTYLYGYWCKAIFGLNDMIHHTTCINRDTDLRRMSANARIVMRAIAWDLPPSVASPVLLRVSEVSAAARSVSGRGIVAESDGDAAGSARKRRRGEAVVNCG